MGALLSQAQIYENDLHDPGAAKERYGLLLKQYPRSLQAEEAKAGIASLEQDKTNLRAATGPSQTSAKDERPVLQGAPNTLAKTVSSSSLAPMPTTGDSRGAKSTVSGANSKSNAEQTGVSVPVDAELDGSAAAKQERAETSDVAAMTVPIHVAKTTGRLGEMAQVKGIRHWSTPNYTRVAIDLGDDVTYEAARVPNPDRIYFDLHGTRLAQELVGKSFTVTDVGFLKKIRAAQFSNDMTRVVLDVNEVTEYSAFLLPNPYRLIIDIHGGKSMPGTPEAGAPTQRAAATPTVPNTTATKAASSFDVAALSAQPGRVEATTQPTSQPISAVDKGSAEQGVEGSISSNARTPTTSQLKRTKRGSPTKDADAGAGAGSSAYGRWRNFACTGVGVEDWAHRDRCRARRTRYRDDWS